MFHSTPKPRSVIALLLLTLTILAIQTNPAFADQFHPLCFPANTGVIPCIVSFRENWEQNGGLPLFGYPLSFEQPERNAETGHTQVVQWFERNRFEAHPENAAP
jgi:hypothetical protein